MKKSEAKGLIEKYGDAIITYRSTNSNKLKYNVCTLDFSTKYVQEKKNRAKETDGKILLFCWDTDSYRILDPGNITSIVPLSSILRNGDNRNV